MSLKLVSFNICPYVLRVVSALNHLKIPYELKYIDLQNKPDWFIKASPLEKVPILFVGETVLFESLVILDYINTLATQSLLPNDNLQRALNRSRAEFSGEIIGTFWSVFLAKTEESFNSSLGDLKWYFEKLEVWLQQSKFIFSNELTLADFAYASLFTLLNALKPLLKFNPFEGFPRLQEYSDTMLSLPGVQQSRVENYDQLIQERVIKVDPFFLKL
ncbi:unnamed protein product (macronuclear) [Paramecium tetraurelia]|uniref:Glutathione S-transferase n=1 Tax=Paramecium tetraurelia TaxID=5888 RepID=A0BM31_PARTE|nr:uncharacterized protein GSPATT00030232001 [Paramecium tetraurelia]CAK59598.1 unnamed protein product [Paramecium tetraurelia]|eukprot:XP_001426996.1 hypothetical protein (macronuclear) [Paramecium tetraurelia strain d4-2]